MTQITQIRVILNLRSLSPLFSNSPDLQAFTPVHLSFGRSLTTVPDPKQSQNLKVWYTKSHDWRLIRAVKLHSITDSIVRVASLQNPGGIIEKVVSRLRLLPLENSTSINASN